MFFSSVEYGWLQSRARIGKRLRSREIIPPGWETFWACFQEKRGSINSGTGLLKRFTNSGSHLHVSVRKLGGGGGSETESNFWYWSCLNPIFLVISYNSKINRLYRQKVAKFCEEVRPGQIHWNIRNLQFSYNLKRQKCKKNKRYCDLPLVVLIQF